MSGTFAGVATFSGQGSAKARSSATFTGRARFSAAVVLPQLSTRYLTAADLDNRVGAAAIDRMLDDDGDGLRDWHMLTEFMVDAEALADSYMLKSWSREQITSIGAGDRSFRGHVAWIAIEMISERRAEFNSADGRGRYQSQYDRAIAFFDRLSKNKGHTAAEETAGKGTQSGGDHLPKTANPSTDASFVFASDKRYPSGHGGF